MLLWGCLPSSVLTVAELLMAKETSDHDLFTCHDLHHAKVNVTGEEWLPFP